MSFIATSMVLLLSCASAADAPHPESKSSYLT